MKMNLAAAKNNSDILDGLKNGLPVFLGYFTTSLAFGILALSSGLNAFEAIIFSATNLTGAAQFMAINLFASGALASEIIISVILINLRYFVMSASLSNRLLSFSKKQKAIVAFGNTDEVFSIAALREEVPTFKFMIGLEGISWLGWTSGTICGVTMGSILPSSLQNAMSGALFALFAALLVPEIKKGVRALIIASSAAILNSLIFYKLKLSEGWSIVISMIIVTGIAAAFFSQEDIQDIAVEEAESE
jgi:4-azaleucine resistance transporter AzlC